MDLDRQDVNITELPEAAQSEASLPRDAYALLAQANLQRMRGLWDDAAQNCMSALRLAPDSSSAQSLLGDIYENQGRLDDAIQWYRMALDANPNSLADRIKLDRLERPSLPSQPILTSAPESRSGNSDWGMLRRLRRDPETVLRLCAILAVLSVALLVGLAFATARHGNSGLGRNADTEVTSAPVLVPPSAGALPSDTDTETLRDQSEQTLLAELQASSDLSAQGIAVYDLQIDPRTQQATVTIGMNAGDGVTRAQVARNALRTLQAATSLSSSLLTARCLLVTSAASGPPTATLVFAGDIPRTSLPTDTASLSILSDPQAEGLFSNVWWSPTASLHP